MLRARPRRYTGRRRNPVNRQNPMASSINPKPYHQNAGDPAMMPVQNENQPISQAGCPSSIMTTNQYESCE
jgi:hypothetical protein